MCGDLEEDDSYEGDLYQRFLLRSRALLARRADAQDPLHGYLDGLFADLLRRCVDDAQNTTPADAYRLVAMQSVALARLAGFLAGHGALTEDPLRKLLEATMLGYGEAEAPLALDDHDHGHSHGGHHGPDHEHDHDHHHGHDHHRA